MTLLLRLALPLAWFCNLLSAAGALIALWLLWRSIAGGSPEMISMIFAVGVALVPNALAATMHRVVELEARYGG